MGVIEVRLKSVLDEKNMNMMDLHRMTGIAQNSLSLFANQKTKGVQYDTLSKLTDVLNVDVSDLIQVKKDFPYEGKLVSGIRIEDIVKELLMIRYLYGNLELSNDEVRVVVCKDGLNLDFN